MSEIRALHAALSGPVFHGAATRSALHASERHVERWAPEGPKATRSGGMRSLSFADRVAAPWMAAAMESRGARMLAQPTTDRATPGVSWVFPRPWFQDELDWVASARMRAEQTPQFLTTRGTYEASRSSSSDVAMPMVSPDMVAPSMASFGMPPGFAGSTDAGYGQVHHGLRNFSSMVPFAAAAAAEVVAGTIDLAQQSGLASVAGAAGRSPILNALALVAPSSITPTRSAFPTSTQAMAALTPAAPAPMTSTTRALIDAARAAVSRVEDVRHAPTADQPSVTPSAVVSQPSSAAEPSTIAATAEAPVASASEHAIAEATTASPQMSRALRSVDLLLAASSPTLSATAETPASTFAPMVGPRVAMPAGLGGLVTALDAQHTTTHPMARIGGMHAAVPASMTPALAASVRALEMPTVRAQMPRAAAPGEAAPQAPQAVRDVPGFAPVWTAPATALGSIAAERARAVDHVAWSDRWLARFVGASPVALAALDVAHEHAAAPASGFRTMDVAAPEMSYLRPPMPAAALAAAIRGSSEIRPLDVRTPEARAAAPAPAPRPPASPDRALRIDDNEAVSDDIFAAIAAAAVAPPRPRPAAAPTREEAARAADHAAAQPMTLTSADVVRAGSRPTIADLLSIAPPPAPGAGLAPGLASSPMAPAMAAMLPLPSAPVFDTRALYPEALSSAYLGGLLSRSAAPIGVVSSAPTMSTLAAAAGVGGPTAAFAAAPGVLPFVGFAHAMGDARAWSTRDLSVAPSSLRLAEAAPERVVIAAEQARRANVQMSQAPMTAAPSIVPSADAPIAPVEGAPIEGAPIEGAPIAPAAAPAPAAASPLDADLVGLRAALLAGGATSVPLAFAEYLPMLSAAMSAPAPFTPAPTSAPSVAAELSLPFVTSAAASSMAAPAGARGLALPAVGGITTPTHAPSASRFAEPLEAGEMATPGVAGARDSLASLVAMQAPVAATSTGRPGALAENLLSWSVAEERAVTDLSFDFVAPEMVLAAKVYGLSPGAAAQAARLAVAGPSAIASLATSIDLTFLRSFQQVQAQQGAAAPFAAAQRAAADSAFAGAQPTSFAPDGAPIEAPAARAPSSIAAPATAMPAPTSPASMEDAAFATPPMPAVAGSVLSSPRLPRGAFLWPEATVAALGLRAMSPEGVAGMPVVALELLAAAAVADLGTWVTAFPSADQQAIANVIRGLGGTVPTTSTTPGPMSGSVPGPAPLMTMLAPSLAAAPAGSPSAAAPLAGAAGDDVPDTDAVPELAAAPRDLRARFESIYVALARTGDGHNLSPSARAARAMALLAREDGGTTSARERALAAWSMVPNVYQGGMDLVAPRDAGESEMPAETRPGLAALAARAGESLGSFVAPSAREVSSWRGDDAAAESSLASRVEMPVYVNTGASPSSSSSSSTSTLASAMARPGRTFSQSGGGEPEIPAWFEAAARRMLDDRNPGAGMSLAELVLVTTAATPTKSIAAATRGASSSPAAGAPPSGSTAGGGPKPDVDKLALEVYQEVLRLIDIARERSGDPYQ